MILFELLFELESDPFLIRKLHFKSINILILHHVCILCDFINPHGMTLVWTGN